MIYNGDVLSFVYFSGAKIIRLNMIKIHPHLSASFVLFRFVLPCFHRKYVCGSAFIHIQRFLFETPSEAKKNGPPLFHPDVVHLLIKSQEAVVYYLSFHHTTGYWFMIIITKLRSNKAPIQEKSLSQPSESFPIKYAQKKTVSEKYQLDELGKRHWMPVHLNE